MRKILLASIISASISAALAQPAGDIFPDFTFNDLEGTEHHLQSYLDDNKIVVIDVFATWCGNCQNSVSGMEQLYNTYGQGGDGSMVVLSFERDPSTDDELEYIEEFEVQSPVIIEATQLIADEWNVTYQPRYFVICPDGTFQSELVNPIYNDPQPLIDMSEECEIVSSVVDMDLEDEFTIVNTSVENILFYNSQVLSLEYRIMDLTGAISSFGLLQAGNGQLDLSSLPMGMYLIQLTDGESIVTKRIIKKS